MAMRAAGADEPALRARAEADPGDVDAAAGLADLLFARGDVAAGAHVLIAAIRRAAGEDRERARAHLVGLLDALAPDDGRANDARRELAAALF
jgi:putative thioredoxin